MGIKTVLENYVNKIIINNCFTNETYGLNKNVLRKLEIILNCIHFLPPPQYRRFIIQALVSLNTNFDKTIRCVVSAARMTKIIIKIFDSTRYVWSTLYLCPFNRKTIWISSAILLCFTRRRTTVVRGTHSFCSEFIDELNR